MHDSDGGEPIAEQFDKQRKCLRNEPEEGTLPSEGYKRSGRQLYHILSEPQQEAPRWVEDLIVRSRLRLLITILYLTIIITLIWRTPLSNLIASIIDTIATRIADYPILSSMYRILMIFVVFLLLILLVYIGTRKTVSMIENWVASNKSQLSICLGFDDRNTPGKMAIVSDASHESIKAAHEELGAPGKLKGKRDAKTISYADLLGVPAEEFALENLHVAEWTSTERSAGSSLLAQGKNTLAEVESIHLPLALLPGFNSAG
jgi:hypothetical protein